MNDDDIGGEFRKLLSERIKYNFYFNISLLGRSSNVPKPMRLSNILINIFDSDNGKGKAPLYVLFNEYRYSSINKS
jgi:hypothetical protein